MTRSDEHTQNVMALLREGLSDARIGKRLGLSREEVRATIHRVIDDAHLEDQERAAFLAEQVGIARLDENGPARPSRRI
jgi:DNA-binding NarL/FixJ family response regulator